MDTSLLLIRHAETVWNREGRMQGFQDSPLSDTGRSQAAALRGRLKRVDAIFSSDAPRCLETARLAFGDDAAVTALPSLRERNLGGWEGRLWREVADENPKDALDYKRLPDFSPPGGESWIELQTRLWGAIDRMFEGRSAGRVAAVTSGGSLRAAVFALMGIPAESWAKWATWNTGVTRLDKLKDGSWKLIKFNDVGHLAGTGDGHAVF